MVGPLLVLTALAAAVWAVIEARRARPDRTASMLATFAVGALALRGLLQLASAGAAAPPLALPLAGLAALVSWTALAWLAARAPRRRDLFLRAPFAALAVALALGRAPASAIVAFAALATFAYRWRGGLPTLRLFRLALGAILLVVALGWPLPDPGIAPDGPAALAAFDTFARALRGVALAHALIAVPVLFGAFLQDPSLGIRTVGRRLALSHVLVVAVPLALLGALWTFTTVLGVNSERALVGARAIALEGRHLEDVLRVTLTRPERLDEALAALPAATAERWPGLRVWRVRDGRVVRVAGEPLLAESTLAGWVAGLDSLPVSGVLGEPEGRFLGAAVRATRGPRSAAVALAPLDTLLSGPLARVAGARLDLSGGTVRTGDSSFVIGDATDDGYVVPDSRGSSNPISDSARARLLGAADSARARREAPRGLRITTPADTFQAAPSDSGMVPFLLRGLAQVDGLRRSRGAWTRTRYLLTAGASPREVLGGLLRSTRESPLSFLPVSILALLTLLALLVAFFDIGMVTSMGRSITSAIQALKVGARKLESGDLAHRIHVAGDDDLWDVADTFNQASAGLERARALEHEAERLESELALARRIQARLLPASPPSVAGLEIAGVSEPAREVGGDYFDHIPLGDGRVMLVVADVSGKGVGAALLMSAFRASLMSQDSGHTAPDVLAGRLNEFLHRSVDPGKFVTAFVAFLDGRDGHLVYANAGHNPPVLLRRDGTHDMLTTGGLILGILPGSTFECGEARLEPGDLVALYTDGVTEGADASGEQWGEERLLGALRARAAEPCERLVRALVDEVRAFEGESGPADDITLLVARRI